MAVVVETGSGDNPLANSYADETELSAYAAARGITLSGDPTELLIRSMDYTETQSFKGQKYTQAQPLQWPRSDVTIDGFTVAVDEIPNELKTAQLVTAVSVDSGIDPLATIEPAVKREKVDALEVEYQDGASSSSYNPEINRAFSKLVTGSGGGNQIPVSRA